MGKGISKGRSRRRRTSAAARFLRREGRKLCAAALCTSLIFGNIANTAVAADKNTDTEIEFKLSRGSLYQALQEAVLEGNTVEEEFAFAGEEAEAYENLLEADGDLYELTSAVRNNEKDLKLRVFAHLDQEIELDSAYEVDGSEEIIFLLTNKSDEVRNAVIYVDEKYTEPMEVAPGKAIETTENGSTKSPSLGTPAANAGSGGGTGGGAGTGSAGSAGAGGGSADITIGQEENSASQENAVEKDSEVSIIDKENDSSTDKEEKRQDADIYIDVDTDGGTADSSSAGKSETNAAAGNETETDSGAEKETGTAAGSGEGAGADTGSGTEAGINAGSEKESGTNEDIGKETKTETGTETDRGSGSESQNEAGADNTDEAGDKVSSDSGSDDGQALAGEGTANNGSGSGSSQNADTDRTGTDRTDTDRTDTDRTGTENADAGHLMASVSVRPAHRVMASLASPSTATDSDADADEKLLEGILYNAVRIGADGAAALVFDAAELELDDPALERLASPSDADYVFFGETDNVVVYAFADRGVLPENARLQVTELKEDDSETADKFQEAKDALDKDGTEYSGMMALDISFYDEEDNEIEPDGSVQVSIEMNTKDLPADINPETVAVQHLAETADGIQVNTVADTTDAVEGTVEVKEDTVVAAEFMIDSFSSFTITWGRDWRYQKSITVKYVDENGSEIDYTQAGDIQFSHGEEISLEKYAYYIEGYTYQGARLDEISGTALTHVRTASYWYDYYIQYSNDGTTWSRLPNDSSEILLVYSGSTPTPPDPQPIQQLKHEKYAVQREDGTYDLTLTVSGEVGSVTNKALLDIIYVLDVSGSMDRNLSNDRGSQGQRRNAANTAIRNLTNTLANNENLDTRFALVTFSGNNDYNDGKFNDAQTVRSWTNSASRLNNSLPTSSDGGTNYQAGIRNAAGLLESSREGALTAVVFISDGDPSFYYNSDGYTIGLGNAFDSEALEAAKTAVGNLHADYFFTVGVGPEGNYTNLRDLNKEAVNAAHTAFYEGNSESSLNSAFDEIQSSVTYLLCTDVAVSDTLSDKVKLVTGADGKPEVLTVSVLDSEGNEVISDTGSVTLDGHTISASYNETTKEIMLDFPEDYALERGYTYTITAHIEPTEAAYEAYRQNGNGYTDTPDAGTGTHSEPERVDGFYSNANASVTYTYNGDNKEETYNKPVVQLRPGTLTIEKTIEGLDGLTEEELTALKEKLSFNVKLEWYADGSSGETDKRTNGPDDITCYLKDFTQDPQTGTYSLVIDGLSPDTSYTVSEDAASAAVEGYSLTTSSQNISGTIAKGAAATASFTNTYSQNLKLTVIKQVTGNMGEKDRSFDFTYKIGNGEAVEFSLKNGEDKVIENIPKGSGVIITEKTDSAPGYETSYTVDEKTEKGTVCEIVLQEDKTVTFINKKEINTPTGIFTDNYPYFMMLAAAVLGIAGFAGSGYLRRKRRDRR